MLASAFDRRVRAEATQLVRDARAALVRTPGLAGQAGELTTVTTAVERALADGDLRAVRHQLPVLDALVAELDELTTPAGKSIARDYIEAIGSAVLIALVLRAFVVEAFKIPTSSMYPTLEIGDHIFVNKFVYGVRVPFSDRKLFARTPDRGDVIVFVQPCEPDRDYIKRVVGVPGDRVEVRCSQLHVNGVAVPRTLVEGEGCVHDDYDESIKRWVTVTCSRYRETLGDVTFDTYQGWDRPRRADEIDGNDFPNLIDAASPPSCARESEGTSLAAGAERQRPGNVVVTRPHPHTPPCAPQMHYVVPEGHVFVMGDNRVNSKDSRVWGSVPIANIKGRALFTWLSYSRVSPTDWSGIRLHRIGDFVH